MAQQTKLITKYIAAPLAGLNLISPPIDQHFEDGEATELDNYFIYDSGIRQRAAAANIGPLPDAGNAIQMFGFTSAGLNKQYILISTSAINIYLYDGTGFSAWHAGTQFAGACAFNKKIILPLGGSASADTFNVVDGARVAGAFTTTGNCIGSFIYNNRAYFLNDNSLLLEYGGVGEVAHVGALANFDFGQIAQKGQRLLFGCAWSYNQGVNNQDFLVVGNEAGEIFIYSGDYPAATNFQLVTKLQIPVPLTVPGFSSLANIIKLGQDILVNTTRGVISLSAVMAGKNDQTGYYAVSRKIGAVLSGASSDISLQVPFAYFGGIDDPKNNQQTLYILNYERGAWSRCKMIIPSGTIQCIACQTPPVAPFSLSGFTSYVLIATSVGTIYRLNETTTTASDSNFTYTWQTPFYNFDTPNIKTANRIRTVTKCFSSNSVEQTAKVAGDFSQTAGTADSKTFTGPTTNTYYAQELRPAGIGRWLSFLLQKPGNAMNEIAGMDVYVDASGDS